MLIVLGCVSLYDLHMIFLFPYEMTMLPIGRHWTS
jgi:hypothetical protein